MIINVVIVSIVSRLIIFFYNLDEGTFAHESSHNTNASSEHPVIRHPHRLRHISSIINLANYTYESMKKERGQVQSPVTLQYGANWPCVWGEEVVGALDKLQSGKHDDGWKFTCGLRLLEPPCVIYSLGSNGNMVFEKNVLMINPSCSIHIFDRDQYDTSPWFNNSVIDSGKVQFHRMFVTDAPDKLNAHANPPIMNLRHIMAMLNHTHIDILKLDIEGKEWNLLQAGDFPSFGQIQLECIIWLVTLKETDYVCFTKNQIHSVRFVQNLLSFKRIGIHSPRIIPYHCTAVNRMCLSLFNLLAFSFFRIFFSFYMFVYNLPSCSLTEQKDSFLSFNQSLSRYIITIAPMCLILL